MKRALLLASALLAGCQQAGRSPEATAQAFFRSVQTLDLPTAAGHLHSGESVEAIDSFVNGDEDVRTIRKALWERMEYTVGKRQAGRQGTTLVPVRVKTVDMTTVARNIITQQNGGTMFILNQITDPTAPMREVTVGLQVSEEAGKWKIFSSPDLNAALLGLDLL
ncbi:hypothetical protein [Deinococcus wulumuqiensis]|nr:hypothetical protein [Deinococcus wulumuqiensis]QII20054.1 hypothetical protein G6R31_04210 [Deinococcus wulumuqiensis R12]